MYQFRKELIVENIDAQTSEDAIKALGKVLIENGVCGQQYITEVLQREVMYPTGLPTQFGVVAIPHASSTDVLDNAIGVAKLKNPVSFRSMEDPDTEVPVQLIFLLPLKMRISRLKC